jgi:hypothetical protein
MSRLNWNFGFVESSCARSISSAVIPLTNIAQILTKRVHLATFPQVWSMGLGIS